MSELGTTMFAIKLPGLRAPLNRHHFAVGIDRLGGLLTRKRSLRAFQEMNAVVAARVVGRRLEPIVRVGAPDPGDPGHAVISKFFEDVRRSPKGHLLEIGARARSGISRRDLTPPGWCYTGLDV